METALALLSVQGVLGAWDSLWNHEIGQKLPRRPSARTELKLHAVREFMYALVFAALAWTAWHGAFAWLLAAILLAELGITLWDFVEEDRTRVLPAGERVLHTVLCINFGAILAFLAPELIGWAQRPSAIVAADHGAVSWLLTAYAAGVLAWGVRTSVAVRRLGRKALPTWQAKPVLAPALCRDRLGEREAHVLVTGGTGFIGGALCRSLIADGHKVTVMSRDAAKVADRFGPHARAVQGPAELDALAPVDAVFNLAGAPLLPWRWTSARRAALVASRVETTCALVGWMAGTQRRPRVLVSGSAIGLYAPGDAPATEAELPGTDFQAQLCGAWEDAARRAEDLGVRTVRARIGLVLGRDGGALDSMLPAFRLGLGGRLGSGRQVMSWIHLCDLVALLRWAMADDGIAGAVNATAPEPATNAAFAQALGAALGRPALLPMPAPLLRLALGDAASLLLDGRPVLPQRALDHGFRFRYPTIEAALADILRRPAL